MLARTCRREANPVKWREAVVIDCSVRRRMKALAMKWALLVFPSIFARKEKWRRESQWRQNDEVKMKVILKTLCPGGDDGGRGITRL